MSDFIPNNAVYRQREEQPERDKSRSQRALATLNFTTPLELAARALKIVQPWSPQVNVIELDEFGNVVMRPNIQPAFTPSSRKCSLLFSSAG